MPACKAAFSGSETHTAGDGNNPPDTIVGTTTAVAIENCIVMYSLRSEMKNTEFEKHMFTAHLAEVSSNVVIQWARNNSSGAKATVVEWFVYEFEAAAMEQDVQRGENDNTADPTNITITAVTLAQTMVISTYKTSKRQVPTSDETGYTLALTTTTNLQYDYESAPETGESEQAWQVCEFKSSDILVSHGISTYTTSGTQAISGFTTLGDMFVLQTGNKKGNNFGDRWSTRTEIDSISQISFDNQDNGTPIAHDVSWSVYEILDGGTVEKGEASMADTESVPGTQPSFTALDDSFSGVLQAYQMSNAWNDSTTDDGVGSAAFCAISLDSGGAGLTITRDDTDAPLKVAWAAIEWASVGVDFLAPPPFLITQQAVDRASLH